MIMDTYIRGRGQYTQRHLSVWVDLCMTINPSLVVID